MKRVYYFIAICADFSARQYRMVGILHDNLQDAEKCAFEYWNCEGRSLDRLKIYFSHTR